MQILGIQIFIVICNTPLSHILVNKMKHITDLPLPLCHACKFTNNLHCTVHEQRKTQ